jgi:hypothetical protein
MLYDPPEFDEPMEDLTPQEAHDRWEAITNLQTDDLRRLPEREEHERYLEEASDGREESDPPLPGGPLDDAITLSATPRDEWTADHREEAAEADDWQSRHRAQFDPDDGEDLTPGDGVKTTKADVAGWRWGFDWRLDDDLP